MTAVCVAAGWWASRIEGFPGPGFLRPRPIPAPRLRMFADFDFRDSASLAGWESKMFRGRTDYEIVSDGEEGGMLRARSKASCSALYRRVEIPISSAPLLVWNWKASRFPRHRENSVLTAREDNDFVARVYVIFKGGSILSSDMIEYAWDDRFDVGTYATSPYSERVKIFVIRRGLPSENGGWATEKRDIARDYSELFGKPPAQDIAAIALMSDSDNTSSETEFFIRGISIRMPRQDPAPPDGRQLT